MTPAQVAFFNKKPERYFGVDYFLRPFFGSHPSRQYFSTTADIDPVYHKDHVAVAHERIPLILDKLASLESGMIVGFSQNPDPYDPALTEEQPMETLLGTIRDKKLGLYLETANEGLIRDLPLIQQIKKKAPVIVTVPIGFANDQIQQVIIPKEPTFAKKLRLIAKLAAEGINVGTLLKPIIPFVNDSEAHLIEIIEKAKQAGTCFIYPSFGINLNSSQHRMFMDFVMRNLPGLRNIYMDHFGIKKSWASPKLKLLKKTFVINMKKNKLPFGMKEIISGLVSEKVVQLKLF